MEGDFHEDVLSFLRMFNEEKSVNGPIQSINQKSINELREKNKDLVVSLFANCRLHYMSMTDKNFDLEELCFALKEIKPMTIGQSLKVFKRPNHKDRYSFLIFFLCTNPEIFAQIIYYELSFTFSHNDTPLTTDDAYFFIYNTFPSFFNFFVTNSDRQNAINFILDMFKLHFYIQGKAVGKTNQFLCDFTFSLFLATNPGKFYSSSVKPLMANLSNAVLDKYLRYVKKDGKLVRFQYWSKCRDFSIALIKRMMSCAPLLPIAARQLITALWNFDKSSREFWRTYILDTLVCRYIENFVIMESSDMKKSICREIRSMTTESEETIALVDKLIDKLCLREGASDGISDAVEIVERSSVFTPRDLTIIYSYVEDFLSVGQQEVTQKLSDTIVGLSKPLVDTDSQFLLVRPWKSESILGELDLRKTGGFDEFVDILNSIDVQFLTFSNEDQLSEMAVTYCSYFTNVSQKLRIQTNSRKMKDRLTALDSITYNKKIMSDLSDRLSSGLFFVLDEMRKHNEQKDELSHSFIMTRVLPALIDAYPMDFTFNDVDLFSPTNSYETLIENVSKRVQSLNIPEKYGFFLKRSFFLDFFDRIDEAFQFQAKTKTAHVAVIFSSYCQSHYKDVSSISTHNREIITRAAELLQQVKCTQKVSNNLRCTMNAMNILKSVPDSFIQVAIAMSGNVDVLAFSFFVGGYFKNDSITSIVLSDDEKQMMKKYRSALQKLTTV